MYRLSAFLAAVWMTGLLVPCTNGQDTDKLVVTSGTAFERDGTTRAYLLWQPGSITTTFGMRFGVYRKPGKLDAVIPYERVGIQTLQSNPETLRALLRLGDKVDFNSGMVVNRIAGIYQSTVTGSGLDNGPDPSLGAAEKLSYLIMSAAEDPQLLNQLLLLGRAHPGVMMALGHAFAIEMPADAVHTFEIRELDAGDATVRVIGRVEVNAGKPRFAPAPGPPVQVLYPVLQQKYVHSPKEHLNARLRWGQEDALRREMAATFGFDLYRVPEAVAENLGWDAAAPDREALIALLEGAPQDIHRVNPLPIMIEQPLSLAGAADPSDKETFYYTDDNGLAHGGLPFEDGETFYYFATARDICGRPCEISQGTRVVMCDRLPPLPPRILSVDNVFSGPANPADWQSLSGTQHLRVRIEQLDENDPGESASRYHIYRWGHPREALVAPADPAFNRVGIVDHTSGPLYIDFDDNGGGAPAMPADADKTYWYTVRAEDTSACAQRNFSAHSGAVYGVLRDRAGPGRPDATVEVCRSRPSVDTASKDDGQRSDYGIDDDNPAFIVRLTREAAVIRFAEIKIFGPDAAGSPGVELLETRLADFGNENQLEELFRYPETSLYRIEVRARTFTGWWSLPADEIASEPPQKGNLSIYRFSADALRICSDPGGGPDDLALHEVVDPDGLITPIVGTVIQPAGTREWRVYRRINLSGPLTLIAKAEGNALPNPAPWVDDAIPSEPGTLICYYVQVFDEHGNPSVLVRVKCIRIARDSMPQPMLSEAALVLGPNGESLAELTWFCDPVGVERFELLVAAEATDEPGISGTAISDALGDPAEPLVIGGEFEGRIVSIHQTRRVGASNFAAGPEFSTLIEIPADQKLYFAIRAVGDGPFDERPAGEPSNIVETTWVTPEDVPQPVIPWPARPLPSVQKNERAIADYVPGEGPYFATRISSLLGGISGIVMGAYDDTFEFATDGTIGWLPTNRPPLRQLFRYRPQGGSQTSDSVYPAPFVVYRYQVPNGTFPEVVPNLVQLSPMIDRMSYRTDDPKDGSQPFFVVTDPFFRFVEIRNGTVFIATDGVYGPDSQPTSAPANQGTVLPPYLEDQVGLIVWVDPMPLIKDASYRYLIVCFDPVTGEISRVIPTNIRNS